MKATTACAVINAALFLSIASMVLGLYHMDAGSSSFWPLWLVLFSATTSSE